MKKLFVLKKQFPLMARDEVLALARSSEFRLQNDILILDTNRDLTTRLAQTRSVHEFLFSCSLSSLNSCVEAFPWKKVFKKDFYVGVHGSTAVRTGELAKSIGEKLGHPPVNVRNSSTRIDFFVRGKKVFVGLNGVELSHGYEKRKAHLRPAHHPSSMHPSLAATMVNLTGIWKGTFVDPMCGTGGLLIEAGLMGLSLRGYDNDPAMIRRCQENMEHFGLDATLVVKDATLLNTPMKFVATDVPYGRMTKKIDRSTLYLDFLMMLRRTLRERAVVVFPHFARYDQLIVRAKLKKVSEYSVYIHKTLTRKVVVLT
ncbi:hypothetical protein GF342_04810 [Candidatus Woesearchaeota archaeon]|nr:hypothetical protein [Candidatus Woesearchaeota archaeon]